MSGHLRTPLTLLACVFALALAAGPAQAAPTPMEKRLVERINDTRAAYGLRRLTIGPKLNTGARSWSRHLLRRDSFHHASDLRPGTGEILAWGTCSWFTPARAVRMWLRSPGHRALLLRPGFRFVGTGWTRGAWRSYGCVEMAVARFR
ncbi:MAG TPA: CAP domain-containing protein [Gaiellaceae bacterium]|nr:CAP domain-containing protein [Gaiellaceae bacterium]